MKTSASKSLMTLSAAMALASVAVWAAASLPQMGITEADAGGRLLNAIAATAWAYGGPPAETFKALPGPARGVLIRDLGAWAKAYASSDAFRAAYAAYRTRLAPQAPKFEGTVEDEFKRRRARDAEEMAKSRKNLEKLPPEIRKPAEEALKQSEDGMNTPAMQQAMRDAIASERRQAEEGYQAELANWQTSYPENPNILIAKQLRRFLSASADVDFEAKLVPKGQKMAFADQDDEARAPEWKFCYRAGREAIASGRTIAAAWLKEIEGGFPKGTAGAGT